MAIISAEIRWFNNEIIQAFPERLCKAACDFIDEDKQDKTDPKNSFSNSIIYRYFNLISAFFVKIS